MWSYYDEDEFSRRFRMPRVCFGMIFAVVVADCSFFRRGLEPDATGKLGATPLQKVVAAMRHLSLGVGGDAVD
jgi:hypothetical protein